MPHDTHLHDAPYAPRLVALERLWRDKCAGTRLPARRDFTFETVRPWLGWLTILEVLDGGDDFRCTLQGTNVVERYRVDNTGVKVSDMPAEWRETILPGYRAVLRDHAPAFGRLRLRTRDYDYSWERVILPCAADGATIDTLILGIEDIAYLPLGSA